MGTNRSTTAWSNPGGPHCDPDTSCVAFDRSSRFTNLDFPYCLAELLPSVCHTSPLPDSWWQVDVGEFLRFRLRDYTLRDGDNYFREMLRNWVLQASQDGARWVDLQTYVNDSSIAEPFGSYTFRAVDGTNRAIDIGYRYFRIRQIGRNLGGSYFLNLSGMELYGLLFSRW